MISGVSVSVAHLCCQLLKDSVNLDNNDKSFFKWHLLPPEKRLFYLAAPPLCLSSLLSDSKGIYPLIIVFGYPGYLITKNLPASENKPSCSHSVITSQVVYSRLSYSHCSIHSLCFLSWSWCSLCLQYWHFYFLFSLCVFLSLQLFLIIKSFGFFILKKLKYLLARPAVKSWGFELF